MREEEVALEAFAYERRAPGVEISAKGGKGCGAERDDAFLVAFAADLGAAGVEV